MNDWTTDPAFRFRKKELRGPDPVGARSLRTLREVFSLSSVGGYFAQHASTQIERLRRSGYVAVTNGYATITDAGRALLGQQPRIPK